MNLRKPILSAIGLLAGTAFLVSLSSAEPLETKAVQLLEKYCFDCHDDISRKGNLDLIGLMNNEEFDGSSMFENLITGKMPPTSKRQPSLNEKRVLLNGLAHRKIENLPSSFRRISRHEFVYSVNDLLGTNLDLADTIPEDRGTNDFDSDRKIQLSREMLVAYFSVADEMLEFALPKEGFPGEQTWITNKVKDSHETYNIYLLPYLEGILFSWTRANNGNSYSFFYDHFDPPISGWYELTFDAMKVGEFEEDVSLQIHAGKYYYADDRPQPQRLLDVIPKRCSNTPRARDRCGKNTTWPCAKVSSPRSLVRDTRRAVGPWRAHTCRKAAEFTAPRWLACVWRFTTVTCPSTRVAVSANTSQANGSGPSAWRCHELHGLFTTRSRGRPKNSWHDWGHPDIWAIAPLESAYPFTCDMWGLHS